MTYKPVVEAALEEELVVSETLAQRIKRRWQHSKERALRQQQKAA